MDTVYALATAQGKAGVAVVRMDTVYALATAQGKAGLQLSV